MFKVLQSTPPIPESLSTVGMDFLQQCFRRDPADRPSAAMLPNHPFLHNFHDRDNPLIHPHLNLCHKGDQGDTSSSPKDNTKNRHDVLPASMSTKIFNKTHDRSLVSIKLVCKTVSKEKQCNDFANRFREVCYLLFCFPYK